MVAPRNWQIVVDIKINSQSPCGNQQCCLASFKMIVFIHGDVSSMHVA